MNIEERTECIICNGSNLQDVLSPPLHIPQSVTIMSSMRNIYWFTYQIQHCNDCLAYQIKHLPDINIVYDTTHAFPMGSIRENMDEVLGSVIAGNSNAQCIVEIGGGNGVLSDKILSMSSTISEYYIVDPCYTGNTDNKIIIPHLVESCVGSLPSSADTLVMSHVFEHLYNPMPTLRDLLSSNIKYVYICHPDYDSYMTKPPYNMNILHVEHSFLIDNKSMINIMNNLGYMKTNEIPFEDYCIIWEFTRCNADLPLVPISNPISKQCFPLYLSVVYNTVNYINSILYNDSYAIYRKYIWPCSVHTVTLFNFGVKYEWLNGVLDNSPQKIGKNVYAYDIPCYSFNQVISDTTSLQEGTRIIVFLNGGCYNKEINVQSNENVTFIQLNEM